MGLIENANCGLMPASLLEALASTLMQDSEGNIFFNIVCYEASCQGLSSAIECDTPISDLEAFIVANGFTTDSCGNPAIKFLACSTDGEVV